MKRLALCLLVLAACGDNDAPMSYSNPSGGKLRLIEKANKGSTITLALVVGDAPLTGYSTGFDLPFDGQRVRLGKFTPGTVLDAGSAPIAATAVAPTEGPLAGMLVVAQSMKATEHPADVALPAKAELLSFDLELVPHAVGGVAFDGTASGFVLPSGGLRDRAGNTVVAPADVAIGKLEVR